MMDSKIKALIDKGKLHRRNHFFYWKERDGEYMIMAQYGVIYDLVIWATTIWGFDPHQQITGIDEEGNVAFFKIGGKNAKP